MLFVRRRRRRRQKNAEPIVTTPAVVERNCDGRGVQGQGLPRDSGTESSYYYLPEPMSSPNPATHAQFGLPAGLLLHYHPEPFSDRSTTVETPSTGKGEVAMQQSIRSSIYTGPGMVADVLPRPCSTSGSGKRVSISSMWGSLIILYRVVTQAQHQAFFEVKFILTLWMDVTEFNIRARSVLTFGSSSSTTC